MLSASISFSFTIFPAIGSPVLDAARGNFSTPQIPESGVNRSVQIVNEGH